MAVGEQVGVEQAARRRTRRRPPRRRRTRSRRCRTPARPPARPGPGTRRRSRRRAARARAAARPRPCCRSRQAATGRRQPEQRGRVVLGAPEGGVGLGGGEQHHDADDDHAGHGAGREADQRDVPSRTPEPTPPACRGRRCPPCSRSRCGRRRSLRGRRAGGRGLGSGGWGGVRRDAAAAEAPRRRRRPTCGEPSAGFVDWRSSGGLLCGATGSGSRAGRRGLGQGSKPGSGGITRVSSDSKCQGWRSTSKSLATARRAAPRRRAGRRRAWLARRSPPGPPSPSPPRHIGGADAGSSPVLRSRIAGTWPVGASFQCGSSGCSSTTGPVTSRTVSPAGSAPMMRTRPEW